MAWLVIIEKDDGTTHRISFDTAEEADKYVYDNWESYKDDYMISYVPEFD